MNLNLMSVVKVFRNASKSSLYEWENVKKGSKIFKRKLMMV